MRNVSFAILLLGAVPAHAQPLGGAVASAVTSGAIASVLGYTPAAQTPTATSTPTTGTGVVGAVVNNAAPVEQGSAGAKFITTGWICIAAGSPGTWVPINVFDGN